jgi:phosphomannomutase
METITQLWKKIQSPDFNPSTDYALVEEIKKKLSLLKSQRK